MDYSNHVQHYKNDAEYFDYFDNNKISEQEIGRRYQQYFHLYKLKPGDKFLEIGAGAGFALRYVDQIECSYFPVDISAKNVGKLRQKLAKQIFPSCGDVLQLPFHSNTFDFILMAEVMEHLGIPEDALNELYRILKPAGSIVISVPYKEIITYQLCIHCNKPTPTNAHLHSFDEEKLKNLLATAGFSMITLTTCLNKITNRLHLNLLFKFLPFRLWKIVDGISNKMTDKPASFVVKAKKTNTRTK
jgi:ubiquinone/menaquinone biosynthesis C-methylase UbiE